jgi:Uma2 family endonuclease
MFASQRPRLTFAEYALIEEDSPVRHEFQDGQAWAMAGGSREHAAIAANILGILASQLRGRPCQAHTSDLRIRITASGLATYPDASVICGKAELDPEDPRGHTVLNPGVLIEVLSPTTEVYDRGEKLDEYKRIPSANEILLVAQKERRVEIWRRTREGKWEDRWESQVHVEGEVALASIGCVLSVDDIYRDPLK